VSLVARANHELPGILEIVLAESRINTSQSSRVAGYSTSRQMIIGVCQISGVRAFLVSFFVHSKMDLRPRTYCDLFRVIRLAGCPASALRLSLPFSGKFLFRGVSRAFPARGVSFPAFPGQCCQVGAVLPGGGCLVQAGGG